MPEILGWIITIILIIVIGLLIWLTINTSKQVQNRANSTPIIPTSDKCTRSTNMLINIANLPCCCSGGLSNDNRYVKALDAIVGPTPVPYLTACAGFCQNSSVNSTTEECNSGSSDQLEACINLIKPVNCTGAAFPVAVDNVRLYYIQTAGVQGCTTSSPCAPNPTNCIISTI